MRCTVFRRLFAIGVLALLAVPATAAAQEAIISGSVADSTGGVLPGVTVTALNDATGNTFVAVTDARGDYRVPVRIGSYRITAELAGFTTVTRTAQLLVGQTVVVNLQLSPSTVQETVSVTGEAPLVNTTSSTLGGNIDPRQMQELPINGRNWMDLSLLAPGARQNSSEAVPNLRQGYSQTNIDGQQVTMMIIGQLNQQPRYSRDVIAEFQLITNRFDASQGRSAGMLVNAVTKSGTNNFAGSFSGYFRSDKLNAADFIQKRVLPYANQQMSLTFGGPIRKDKFHFFGNYEYEREPQTITFTSPYPRFNIDYHDTPVRQTGGTRLDYQLSSRHRLSLRGQVYHDVVLAGGGATAHPAGLNKTTRNGGQIQATLTQVLSNRAVNEVRGGYSLYDSYGDPRARWKGGCIPDLPYGCGGLPTILLRGYSVQGVAATGAGLGLVQKDTSIRDDFTTSFTRRGRHDVKLGGEFIRDFDHLDWCLYCSLWIDARNAPVPANIQDILPVWNDISTWNLNALSPITTRARRSVSNTKFKYDVPMYLYAGWLQDDWTVSRRLTLNLGARYDLQAAVHSEKTKFLPWLPGDLPRDKNNLAPRLGATFSLDDHTVVRGGYGLFFGQVSGDEAQQTRLYEIMVTAEFLNDGRPDFASNPFNGPLPTFEQALAGACDKNLRPGCYRREFGNEINHPWRQGSYSHQASAGMQRQIGATMAVQADYVYTGGRLEEVPRNGNLTYNPATGANYPQSDISRRPFPEWGIVGVGFLDGWSNYHGLETAFTKRLSHRWQAQATYTFAKLWDADPAPDQLYLGANGIVARRQVGFTLAPDMGGDYTLAATDQRHRAVFNGIWDAGRGFQLSGIYLFGSGLRYTTNYGGDLRDQGFGGTGRLRPNGTIVPRNSLVGKPIHRMDVRLQQRLTVRRRTQLEGVFEVFNLFNHANYGTYVTQESNAAYGKPAFNSNVAYQPRTLQLGFRIVF